MRTKIGLLAILTAVLLAFGGTAVAQDYGTETDPQDTTATQEPMEQDTLESDLNQEDDLDADVDAEADLNVQGEDEFADDQFADDEFADDELPRTASFLPALGALGLLSLAGGAALRGRKS